jgi:hypothetical protein
MKTNLHDSGQQSAKTLSNCKCFMPQLWLKDLFSTVVMTV